MDSVQFTLNEKKQTRSSEMGTPPRSPSSDRTENTLFSNNSSVTDIASEAVPKRLSKADRKKILSNRSTSVYVKNYRLSRYKTGLYSTIPFRKTNVSPTILPIDNVGCFSNATFAWSRQYHVTKDKIDRINKEDNEVPYSDDSLNNMDNTFLIPKAAHTDSCHLNAKRFLGLYKYEEQTYGRIKSSMFRVSWQFCRTRLIIASLMNLFSILIGLLGLIIFLKFTLDSITLEETLVTEIQNLTNKQVKKSSFFATHLLTLNAVAKLSNLNDINNNTKHDDELKGVSELPQNYSAPNINETATKLNQLNHDLETQILNKVLNVLGIPLCFIGMHFFKSISNWLNLRTALRLRTACITSVFLKALKSSVIYNIAPHQMISLICDETEIIFALIMKGSQIFTLIIGLTLYIIAAIILLGAPGLWPICGIFGLFIIMIVLARISSLFYRTSLMNSLKKLTIVEEFCASFKIAIFLKMQRFFQKQFSNIVSKQYFALFKYEMFSTKFTGGITSAILLGGLYLIWCDTDILTENIPVLILIIMYAHYIQIMFVDICESYGTVLLGSTILEKIKKSYELSAPQISKTKPSLNLQVQMSQSTFEWAKPKSQYFSKYENDNESINNDKSFTLSIDEFFVPKRQIIGITGLPDTGKTSLLYAIMGHMNLVKGKVYLRGKFAFFPHKPCMIWDTIKENITFGMDNHDQTAKYIDVLIKSTLMHDISDQLGKDELPISELKLKTYQLQKIELARALFTDRDIIIFDEPLSAMPNQAESSELFRNVCETLINSNKTVVIASQNDYILRHCQRIYIIDDGHVSGSREYEEIKNLISYHEMTNNYKFLQHSIKEGTIQYDIESEIITNPMQNPDLIKSFNRSVSVRSEHSMNTENNHNENVNKQMTIVKHADDKIYHPFTILNSIKLAILYFINTFGAIGLAFIFIGAIYSEYIEPWMALISVAVICLTFFIDFTIKYFTFKMARKSSKKYQKKLFKSLLKTSVNFINKQFICVIVNLFQDDSFKLMQSSASCVQYIISIFIYVGFLMYINFWNVFAIILLIVGWIAIYVRFKFTVIHLETCLNESRRKITMKLCNMVRGRAILSSFEEEYRKELYNIIEENSTIIYMKKSIVFYTQFLVSLLQVTCLIAVCTTLILAPPTNRSIYHLTFGLLLYLGMSYNLSKFLEMLFDKDISQQKLNFIQEWTSKIPIVEVGDELDNKKEISGVSVNFNEVSVVINEKTQLNIKKINVRKSENIGFSGIGSEFIAQLLYRIKIPTHGAIFIGQRDISTISRNYLDRNIGIIPQNPLIHGATIKYILDPFNEYQLKDISSALQRFHLWEIVSALPKEIDEPIRKLSREHRQLLCLARCWLQLPSIIIIEKLHPTIQSFVDTIVNDYFKESTIIVIGSNNTHFTQCNRIIELN